MCSAPADAAETVVSWRIALTRKRGPTVLILPQQAVPVLDRTRYCSADRATRDAHILSDAGKAHVSLIAAGSEVHLALEAQSSSAARNVHARVVSMPGCELRTVRGTVG